jgi:hypothetical protein
MDSNKVVAMVMAEATKKHSIMFSLIIMTMEVNNSKRMMRMMNYFPAFTLFLNLTN